MKEELICIKFDLLRAHTLSISIKKYQLLTVDFAKPYAAFLRRCLCKVSENEVDLLLATECPVTDAVLRFRLGTISIASPSSIVIPLPGSSMVVAPALVNAFYNSIALSLDFVGS